MKNLMLILAILFGPALMAQNHVVVYRDCDFGGSSHILNEGNYRADQLGVGNDQISALRIPSGWRVTVYTDNNYGGSHRTFEDNVACMPADFNDKISSIRVARSGSSSSSSGGSQGRGVTLYTDCDYRGSNHTLSPGTYNSYDLGIGNDRLSSIRVPRGYMVTVYTDDHQRGYSQTFESDERCFSSNLNDKVSSISVERTGGDEHMPSGHNSGGGSGVITLYEDCNYRGSSHRIGLGRHNAGDLGIGNDRLSSIRIPRGYTVSLYVDNYQNGYMQILEEDVSCLPQDLNDAVSSILVERTRN